MEMMNLSREKLIISADDFGMNSEANQRILQLARSGKIDRVAVLIDRQFSQKELDELIASQVKLDLHLDTRQIGDQGGVFQRTAFFLFKYLAGRISSGKIEEKWERQTKKFISVFGRKPDGLNSHQYIHFFPAYFKIALKLGEKYKIPYVRFGKKGIAENVNSISGILSWLRKKNLLQFEKFSFNSSDFLASYDWVIDFPLFLEKLPTGKTELIFHPERKAEFEIVDKYF